MQPWQHPFSCPCYIALVMDNDRRLFLGLLGTTAVAGLSVYLLGGGSPADAATFEVQRSPADSQRRLGPERFPILRQAGTERAFTSPLLEEHRKVTFSGAGCGFPSGSSVTKDDSGTPWP